MNTMHRGVITLIRSALTGEKLPLPEGFSLDEADSLIRRQSLLPLVYRGAENCGLPLDTELMQQYQQAYFRQVIRSAQQTRAVDQLLKAFEENGIDYMPLKGYNLKKLYPQPEMRMMGDADILIRVEQYGRIKPLMQSLDYEEAKESPYDFCWQGKHLYVELHKQLFGPNQTDLCGYFGNGWKTAVKGDGFGHTMCPEDEYVYIFSHMMKHFRYCGIGARQIVDLYVFAKAFPALDKASIDGIMDRIGIGEFHRNICRLLKVWFEGAADDSMTDFITEYVFSSGNFGSMQNKLYSEELINAQKSGQIKGAKSRTFVQALFLPLEQMQDSYNILYKYPILLPVFWVVRWFDVLLHRRSRIAKKFEIIHNMTDEKVEQYQQALAYMGLDYHFVEDED